MQFKVPQNIDLADRIVGPLTLVQFLYLLVGGIVIYVLFSVVAPINVGLFFTLSFPIALFSFGLAFLKIQDQPFGKFVMSFLTYLIRPKTRVWTKEGLPPEIIVADTKPKHKERVTPKAIKKSELEKLTQALDTGGHVPQPAAATVNQLKPKAPRLDAVGKKS